MWWAWRVEECEECGVYGSGKSTDHQSEFVQWDPDGPQPAALLLFPCGLKRRRLKCDELQERTLSRFKTTGFIRLKEKLFATLNHIVSFNIIQSTDYFLILICIFMTVYVIFLLYMLFEVLHASTSLFALCTGWLQHYCKQNWIGINSVSDSHYELNSTILVAESQQICCLV